mgnify:CR=1 FL=1
MKRRDFLKNTAVVTAATVLASCDVKTEFKATVFEKNGTLPMVISTWNHGIAANQAAMDVIQSGGKAIDAVEAGVRVPESDPEMRSVGYGGLPDREGQVTLDACIMDETGNCGAVSYLQHIKNPISVARKVMDETPHVMLSGQGALDFALEQGFKKENLLTKEAEKRWKEWLKESKYQPIVNIENHDTIGMLAIDEKGDIAGACTTSGLAWKMNGRVGDSPIIGAGLFLDNEVGAAAATGLGEAVIRTSGSAMVVELMRQGHPPLEACKLIVDRISKIHRSGPDWDYLQVGFIAINKKGEYAGYSLKKGFDYAVCDNENQNSLLKADYSI